MADLAKHNQFSRQRDALGAFARAMDGIVIIDDAGQVVFYDKACERLFGYRANDVIGQNVTMLIPAGYKEENDDFLSHFLANEKKCSVAIRREIVGRRTDGTNLPVSISVGEGRLWGKQFFVCIIKDRSVTRKIEQGVGSDQLLAQIVKSSDEAIISKTLDGAIRSWNASAERIFGYTAEDVIGKNINILLPPDRLAEEERMMERLKEGHEIDRFETVRLHKSGREVPISISVAPIRDESGAIIGASKMVRDISEKRSAELRALALQNELAHVGRLTAVAQMSASIAHELNQPLTAIANYVKAAQYSLEGVNISTRKLHSARHALSKAFGQTIRAGTIIRNLREFLEKKETERSPENLSELIQEAVSLGLIGHSHSSLKIVLDLETDMPPVIVDKVQVQQVFLNLIRNAREALTNISSPRLLISSSGEEPGFARIVVRDNGPGLPQEIASRLFQPFVTTKRDGMGIGLKICQSILEAHAGSISLLEKGPGATFLIRLPLALRQAP